MFYFESRTRALRAPALLLLLLAALAFSAPRALAQDKPQDKAEEPPYHEYKGIRLGMTTDEARKKLGNPADKSDKQDSYVFNDNESCQVYYDDTKKVYAVAVTYLGGNSIPTPKIILGIDAEVKQDGSVYKMIRYPKVGYWVSYTRTSGDAPMTLVTMQKIQ
jgi:hypothetical protein